MRYCVEGSAMSNDSPDNSCPFQSTVLPAFSSCCLLKESGSTHLSNDEFLNHSGANHPPTRQPQKTTLSKPMSSPTAVSSITPAVGGSRRLISTLFSKD